MMSRPKSLTPKELSKPFLVSAGAGAVFGLIAGIIIVQQGFVPFSPILFVPAITLATASFAGGAGLVGALLESRLASWGVKGGLVRLAISFTLVAFLTLAITFAGTSLLGDLSFISDMNQFTLLGAAAGITFGAIFALFNYRAETIRQRIQLLELENRHLADLASREELLREAARNLAVAEERNRMARELHDSISQGVHGIVYSLRSLRAVLADNPRGREILGHLEETAADTLKELRRLVMELTPSPLEDQDLEDALRLHCDLFARRQQLELELDLDYRGRLQPDQEVALYRITQEALTNVQKHAAADRVRVSLRDGAETILTIEDDGKGFVVETVAGGHGLHNMANRARQSGGVFEIRSRPGQGTTVIVKYSDTANSGGLPTV